METPTHHRNVRSTQAAEGFTLVELLVVIGIIAVLIGVLLPSLSAARADSQRVACMAKLREVGNGLLLYAGTNKGTVAFQLVEANRLGVGRQYTWFGSYRWVRSALSDFNRDDSLLAPYLGKRASLAVADCPTMTAMDARKADGDEDGYSPSFGGAYFITTADNSGNNYIKLTEVSLSPDTIMLADTGTADQYGLTRWNWTNEPYWDNSTQLNIPRFHGRHRGKGNVLWFDGHVTSETPGYIPPNLKAVTGGGAGADVMTPEKYRKINLGFLVRGNEPFSSPTINYYYYTNKEARRLRPR